MPHRFVKNPGAGSFVAHRLGDPMKVIIKCLEAQEGLVLKKTVDGRKVMKPLDIAKLMRELTENEKREIFVAFLLNTKNKILTAHVISIGSLNASIVHPREILKPAITHSAASIILAHNHPTGDPTPSREDIEFTRRFAKCGDLIGIEVLDHVVVGDKTHVSLKEAGYF